MKESDPLHGYHSVRGIIFSLSNSLGDDCSVTLFGNLIFDAFNESRITGIVVKFLIEVILFVFQNTV